MSSILRSFIDRLYPSTDRYPRVTIVGLPDSGKTTILYLLKLKEIVQTIPSIGFNAETIDAKTSSGKTFRMTGWDIGTGCGISYLYGILRVYVEHSAALIWVVDASDKELVTESVEALKDVLRDAQNVPILILANKCDKPKAMSVDEIRLRFSAVTSGRFVSVFRTCCTAEKGVKNSGLPEAFDWLLLALESGKRTEQQKQSLSQMLNPRAQTTLADKLESWLARIETDTTPDEFLERFKTFTLPSWDHYTHIRIAYVLLTKYGRKEGKDMIFKGLERYISVSPQTKGKSFHVTMTYFWIQIVHFGIRQMPSSTQSPETTSPPSSSDVTLVSPNDFAHFLLINPYVADGNLWADYYSKDVIMTPKAKEEMVLPDRKPLPNLVIRDAISTSTS